MNTLNKEPNVKAPEAIKKYRNLLRKITVSAIFLSIALVLKLTVSFYLPFLGAAGIKIDFAGIFTVFPAFLFGPVYGGVVCAAADLLAAMIKPNGAFIPWLTVTAFASGFMSGLAWKLIKRFTQAQSKTALRVTALLLVLIFAFGAAGQLSLNSDGIISGIYTDSSSLPRKGELAELSLSPFSRFLTDIAQYTNDTLTLDRAFDSETADVFYAAIPEKADSYGSSCKITSISNDAFDDCINLTAIFIPSSVKTIGDDTFKASPTVNIYTPKGSAAQSFADSHGFGYTACDFAAFTEQFDNIAEAGASFTASDTYRPYLAAMINLLTLGVEILALFGLMTLAVGYFASANKGIERREGYMRVFTAIFIPRFIVTTINTQILRVFIGAWAGRSFIILWIPRALEEIIGCVIQGYIILLLLGIYEHKIKPHAEL